MQSLASFTTLLCAPQRCVVSHPSLTFLIKQCVSYFSRVSILTLIFVKCVSHLLCFLDPDNGCSNHFNAIWCFPHWVALLAAPWKKRLSLRLSNTCGSWLEGVGVYPLQFAGFSVAELQLDTRCWTTPSHTLF